MIAYLISRASTGKFRFMIIECDEEWHDDYKGYLITRKYGQIGGKTTNSPIIIIDRTKQNRTWKEQYTLQFNSKVKEQLDKGYIEVNKDPNSYSLSELQELYGDIKTNQKGVIKPMLAKQADKVTNIKIFNNTWLASRKLDGVRCLLYYKDSHIFTASRGGEDYNAATDHIRNNKNLINFFENNPDVILDGELYRHGKTLQQISGAARLEVNAYDCDWLQYIIYDYYKNPDESAKDREQFLKSELTKYDIPIYKGGYDENPIKLLEQIEVSGWDNIMKLHDQYVSEGFEGVVIRDPDKPYKPGGRTNSMIKIKKYKDGDFKVIGYELGLRGSEDMVFICELPNGKTFKAMPVGDRSIKQEYVDKFEDKYKGHLAECTYFNYSDDGIPTQPKLRTFRFDLE